MYRIPKHYGTLQGVASSDATRYNITGVFFDGERKCAVATNGHALAVKPLPDAQPHDEAAPIFPLGKIAELPTAKKSRFAADWTLNEKGINEADPGESVKFVDGTFPQWQDADMSIRNREPVATVGISADLLLRLAKAIEAPSHDSKFVVQLDIYESEEGKNGLIFSRPIRVSGGANGGYGLIMPARLK